MTNGKAYYSYVTRKVLCTNILFIKVETGLSFLLLTFESLKLMMLLLIGNAF